MEYYRKCNVCGTIKCFDDIDIELFKISQIATYRSSDIFKCSKCGSRDIALVTKNYAKYSYKVKGEIKISDLIKNAKKYLTIEEYSDAFCFSNAACEEEPFSYDACLIRFLASVEVSKIEDLSFIIGDLSKINYFKELFLSSSEEQKKTLAKINVICKNNSYIYNAEQLLKQPNKFSLVETINKYINKISSFKDENDYSDLIKKLKLKKKKIIYNAACNFYEEENLESLNKAIRLFKLIENYKDSKELLEDCQRKISQYEIKGPKSIISLIIILIILFMVTLIACIVS